MRRILRFAQGHVTQALGTVLMMALVAMFVHAITDRGELRRRVNEVERECTQRGGQVNALKDALDTRTTALQRELDQRTSAMQREVVAVCDRMDQRFTSIEKLIDTLISVLRENGVGMMNDPRLNIDSEG